MACQPTGATARNQPHWPSYHQKELDPARYHQETWVSEHREQWPSEHAIWWVNTTQELESPRGPDQRDQWGERGVPNVEGVNIDETFDPTRLGVDSFPLIYSDGSFAHFRAYLWHSKYTVQTYKLSSSLQTCRKLKSFRRQIFKSKFLQRGKIKRSY